MTDREARGTVAGEAMRAPRGAALSCKGWEQEAALRMLMNCADPDVAERAARASDSNGTRATIVALRELEGGQTLLLRSDTPAGVFRTRTEAPRVMIAAGGAAGDKEAAVSGWLCVGTQSGLPTAYEAFATAARKHFAGTLAGRLVVACGMGATGSGLPLAATLNGAAFLGVEADPEQIKRRVKSGYCEVMVNDLDEALRILKNSVRKREPASAGLIGNCADVMPELARRGIVPDLLVDCTPAYGAAGYIPSGVTAEQAHELQRADAQGYRQRALDSAAAQVRGILELKRLGSQAFRFGSGLNENAEERGVPEVREIPDFAAEYIQPLWSSGRTLLLWVALSGEPADIVRADGLALDLFSSDESAARWIRLAGKHVQFKGLPARVCLVDEAKGLRAKFGSALNELVARGALKAPMVIGCDDFGHGNETPPAKSTGSRSGGADAASGTNVDALLAGLSARARAASWVAIEDGHRAMAHGSPLPTLAVVADGTAEMAGRIARVLGDDSGGGVARPADASRTPE